MITIPIPGTGDWSHVAAGAGAVWVTTGIDAGHAGVYRIDPRRNRVTAFIRLPPNPIGITVAFATVWVGEPRSGPGIVLRIDPRTNRVAGPPITAGVGASGGVAGFGALWVTNGNGNGSVTRIDPATGATRTLTNIPDVNATGAGSLWVIPNHGGIQRADPATGQVTATISRLDAVGVIFWAGWSRRPPTPRPPGTAWLPTWRCSTSGGRTFWPAARYPDTAGRWLLPGR